MPEARRRIRVKTLLGAQIIFNNRMSTIDCVIKNISSSGAKLVVASTVPLPGEFELRIPLKGCSYPARLIRRSREELGVEFLKENVKRSPEEHIREFEDENAQLKARILVLSKRLADLGHDPDTASG